ncbi:uncharacterized protein FIBRA_00846 [Fibroporia radiculosa]|uniref:Tetraspanin Tsp2 n=1 Tax=Fibroporia radiculosa TaxID=599839 RepID=J4I859_9APHY|nr:uncharacterized protein FIBRA_00846 [Fibroporia radiculosa]CCL98841.1 predicted protein [Fibroporia radiculosa]
METYESISLEPPHALFQSRSSTLGSLNNNGSLHNVGSDRSDAKSVPSSLSVNYLPSKFSSTLLSGGPKRRKVWRTGDASLPKHGGGREAFKSDEARMPGEGDDDFDRLMVSGHESGYTKRRQSWNRFKWTLFVSNFVFTMYSIAGLVVCLMLWFNIFTNADIIRVANHMELILSTLAASLGVLTALVGWSGILLNNRTFLAVYCTLLWVCFGLLVTPGYTTYKRRTFNLEGKLGQQWSQLLGLSGRRRVQDVLHCCGYFSPFVEAAVSQTCYARSVLPGCKGPFLRFERAVLGWWYTIVFAAVPVQIAVMVASILSASHVTYRFGKGMMPKPYQLDVSSLAIIMENYASQLAEQYGPAVASEMMVRSGSGLHLDSMPIVPYMRNPSSNSSGSQYSTSSGEAPRPFNG